MDYKPLVSIGVPTYNRPVTLNRAISSLVNQTYRNIEVIISDNCSTNSDVQKVIDQFQTDPRIKFIKQPYNKGLTENFNFLLSAFSGEYIMRLADDDWLDLNYIESCVNFLMENPAYKAAYGRGKTHDLQGNFVLDDSKIDLVYNSGSERVKQFLSNVTFNACLSAVVPKTEKQYLVMKDVIAGDWLIVSKLAFLGKYKMLEDTNLHISWGGMSNSVANLTKNMPRFIQHFPYSNVILNFWREIVWQSDAYQKISFLKRLRLAYDCGNIIYKRHGVQQEVRSGLKRYFNYSKDRVATFTRRALKRSNSSNTIV